MSMVVYDLITRHFNPIEHICRLGKAPSKFIITVTPICIRSGLEFVVP